MFISKLLRPWSAGKIQTQHSKKSARERGPVKEAIVSGRALDWDSRLTGMLLKMDSNGVDINGSKSPEAGDATTTS